MSEELPPVAREKAANLAREEREASDSDRADALRAEREGVLEEYGFRSRVRTDEDREILVCYPRAWIEDDTVRFGAIESLDRAIEIPLTEAEDPEDWRIIADENRRLAAEVRTHHGKDHGENAAAFATFMNNHRATHIQQATADDLAEFLEEYYPRNVWPSATQREIVEESVALLRKRADRHERSE